MNNVFNQAYDTVICIGNSKHYLAHLNELEYARCVIAEPDKNSAKKCNKQLSEHNCKFVDKVITSKPQETASWYISKPGLYSGSIQPTDLFNVLPGLQVKEHTLPAQDITSFITENSEAAGAHLLIIAESNASALSNALSGELLSKFTALLIISPQQELFENLASLSKAKFEKNCFDFTKKVEGLLITTCLTKNVNKVEIKKLNEQLLQNKEALATQKQEQGAVIAELTKERDEQAEWHQKNKSWAESLKVDLEKVTVQSLAYQQQLEAANEQSIQQVNTHRETIELLNNDLKQAQQAKSKELIEVRAEAKAEATTKANTSAEQIKNHMARISELENQLKASNEAKAKELTEATAEVRAEEEQNKNKTARISELQAQLAEEKETNSIFIEELTKERDEQAHWHQENKKWAETLKANVLQLEFQLNEKSRSGSLGQKMLAKAQIDLDALRELYAEKVVNEKELVDLVKELREKLTLASKYYFNLQQEHPELLSANEFDKDS